MNKIKYLLVLVDKQPPEGKDYFINQLLNSLRAEGRPYFQYVDKRTKIEMMAVGPQKYDGYLVGAMAMTHFRRIWGHEPVLDNIHYQIFGGIGGYGATIEEWEGPPPPDFQIAVPAETQEETKPAVVQIPPPKTKKNVNKKWFILLFAAILILIAVANLRNANYRRQISNNTPPVKSDAKSMPQKNPVELPVRSLVITDENGTQVELKDFFIDYTNYPFVGGFYTPDHDSQNIRIYQGAGIVTVNWSRIKSVTINYDQGQLQADLLLLTGEKKEVKLVEDSKDGLSGKTMLGPYSISLSKVKVITTKSE